MSSPEGNAESVIAINPADPNFVIAGSNGLNGQDMHFSTDGGVTWTEAGPRGGSGTWSSARTYSSAWRIRG